MSVSDEAETVTVPLRPTLEMELAGQQEINLSQEPGKYEFLSRYEIALIWAAMIAAAPEPPK